MTSDILAQYPTNLFNKIVATGEFPEHFKIAKIVPIYKKEDPSDPSNYRPISILPILSKVFEKVIYQRMVSFLSVTKQQSVRLPNKSLINRRYLKIYREGTVRTRYKAKIFVLILGFQKSVQHS